VSRSGSFFAAREYRDLNDLNAQATAWCLGPASERPCPKDTARSVQAAFEEEQSRLLALPENPFPTEERVAVKAGKTPYVRFDRNDYSIPHDRVQRTLTVLAIPDEIRIVEGAEVLARHVRSYDQGAQIEDPTHLQALVAHKRAARQHRGTDRLAATVPQSRELLTQAAHKGDNLGAITAALLRLLERYGTTELAAAIDDALGRGVPHPNAVRLALERRREARELPPPLGLQLSPEVKERDRPIRPHDLTDYDRLSHADARQDETPQSSDPQPIDIPEESSHE